MHLLILRGVKEAAALNTIATFAKIVPIAIFIVVAIAGFRRHLRPEFLGRRGADLRHVASQARASMLVTVFLFVGIEGASVYSRYASNRNDVGIATVLGFLGVLCLLVLVTMLSYGVMLRPDLAAVASPSMAGVMEAHRRAVGQGLHQRRPDRLRPRQLPVVVAAGRGGAVFGGRTAHHAGRSWRARTPTRCRWERCG